MERHWTVANWLDPSVLVTATNNLQKRIRAKLNSELALLVRMRHIPFLLRNSLRDSFTELIKKAQFFFTLKALELR